MRRFSQIFIYSLWLLLLGVGPQNLCLLSVLHAETTTAKVVSTDSGVSKSKSTGKSKHKKRRGGSASHSSSKKSARHTSKSKKKSRKKSDLNGEDSAPPTKEKSGVEPKSAPSKTESRGGDVHTTDSHQVAYTGEATPDIVVEKSGQSAQTNDFVPPPEEPKQGFWARLFHRGPKYRYLSANVRREIDQAPVRSARWKYIVVHNSGTRQGNAKIFDYYHRKTRHMPNGMAYHFVIGNGTSTGNGQVEIGERWRKQINGGHVHSDYLNNIALGICLVGDFNRDHPTKAQYEALQELIEYLRKRVGRVDRQLAIVKAHKEINPVPTDCPGARFSYSWLHREFD